MSSKFPIVKKKRGESRQKDQQILASQQATLEFEKSRQEDKKNNSIIIKLPVPKNKSQLNNSSFDSSVGQKDKNKSSSEEQSSMSSEQKIQAKFKEKRKTRENKKSSLMNMQQFLDGSSSEQQSEDLISVQERKSKQNRKASKKKDPQPSKRKRQSLKEQMKEQQDDIEDEESSQISEARNQQTKDERISRKKQKESKQSQKSKSRDNRSKSKESEGKGPQLQSVKNAQQSKKQQKSKKILTQITEQTDEKQATVADELSDEEEKEMQIDSFGQNLILSQNTEFQLDLDKLVQTSVDDLQMQFEPKIFRATALKNFLTDLIVDIDPQISIAKSTQGYYNQIFLKYILEKDCYELWKTRNDKTTFEGWPAVLKIDHFMEQCFTDTHQNELTFLYR